MSKISADEKNCHEPRTLFHISLEFIAQYIEYVESLCDFPEAIGETLFNAVQRRGISMNDEAVLNIFAEAYPHLLLERLILHFSAAVLEEVFPIMHQCFKHIRVLDLYGCGIGDKHEVLEYVGNNAFLTHLGLSHNALSDAGIQRYTTPLRMFDKGPKFLKILDVSSNPCITDKSIRFIIYHPSLEQLDMSGTALSEVGRAQIESKLHLFQDFHHSTEKSLLIDFSTMGWAASLITEWTEKKAMSSLKISSANTLKFYKRSKRQLQFVQEIKNQLREKFTTPCKTPKYIFKGKRLITALPPSQGSSIKKNCYKLSASGSEIKTEPFHAKNKSKKGKANSNLMNLKSVINVVTQECEKSPEHLSEKVKIFSADQSVLLNENSNILQYYTRTSNMKETDI